MISKEVITGSVKLARPVAFLCLTNQLFFHYSSIKYLKMKRLFPKLTKGRKVVYAFAVVILATLSAHAQGDVETALAAGTSELASYLDPITTLVMAIGGIVGIVGGIRIYNKWNNGDQDINKEILGWGGSALFLILVPLVIKGIFGL